MCLILLIMLTFSGRAAFAQLDVRYDEIPRSKIKGATPSSVEGSEVAISDEIFSLQLPFRIGNPVWLFGYQQDNKNIAYTGFEDLGSVNDEPIDRSDLPRKLFRYNYSFGMIYPRGNEGYGIKVGRNLMTDRKEISDEDFGATATLFYLSDLNGYPRWTLGVAQSFAFGDRRIFPIVGYETILGSYFHFKAILPFSGQLTWIFANGLVGRLSSGFEGAAYRLTEDKPWESSILGFSNLKTTLRFGLLVYDPFILTFGVGYISHRRYDIVDKKFNDLLEIKLRDANLYSIELTLIPF